MKIKKFVGTDVLGVLTALMFLFGGNSSKAQDSSLFNLKFYLQASYMEDMHGDGGRFRMKHLRLESTGNISPQLSYRLRIRLNRETAAQDDGLGKNIDYMLLNYMPNEKIRLTAGRKDLTLGGFEFYDKALHVVEHSDFVGNMYVFNVGFQAAYMPWDNQLFQIEACNAANNKIIKEYPTLNLKQADHPLAYNLNWTGQISPLIKTMWSYTYINEADGYHTQMVMLGTKLDLKKIQTYFDYYGSWEDIDKHGIVSRDNGSIAMNTQYNSYILNTDCQPFDGWNCILKGMIETASCKDIDYLKNYRTSYGWWLGIQRIFSHKHDLRLTLSYCGKEVRYKSDSPFSNNSTGRIELTLMGHPLVFSSKK
ncbi:MAG: OprO/OprP family phosphate-selective porin [Bacteroidales bacterium]|nr:OprO/OprP family phosphate-selective porin [Bacteroidales bacterium]